MHSLKWVDGDGIEHLEVIRAWTREEVNQRVIELKRLIRAARDAKPTPPAERPPAETNGQAHDAVDEPRCPIHGTAKLKPSKKHGGVYCSGKLDAGAWCQYKAKGGK